MSDSTTASASIETREEAGSGGAGIVKFWLAALDLAEREEADWIKSASETEAIYRGGTKAEPKTARRFNILYSNTETIAAAAYNSTPVPDIRRRFNDEDQQGRMAAQVLERCLSFSMDEYDVDAAFRLHVRDALVPGRGVLRVRYEPTTVGDDIVYQRVWCEPVEWQDFRRGPAKQWQDVPWLAFRHYLSRAELKKLDATIGAKINLDYALPDAEKGGGENTPDQIKRALVWEIWDKERREVLFIAPSYEAAPLTITKDPLGLGQFFPVPRPLQPIENPGSLTPIEPYRLYSGLAEELERLTKRSYALANAIKWRGAYLDPQIGDFLTKFEQLDDGEMAPLDNPAAAAGGGLDKAFWFQPTKEASEVLLHVFKAREQTKQAIYEITGIADLLRGASVASETATAQSIKAQWGSLRISVLQAEVQRVARDVMRIKAEIIAEKFEPQILQQMSGIALTPDAAMLLKADPLRRYRIDVETDSTIRADLARQQQNIAGFVQGFGTFVTSVGPAVQTGALPMPVVTEMIKSFARVFKLGRGVEEALDSIPTQIPQLQNDEQARQADVAKEQAKQQAEAQKIQAQLQMKQMDIEAEDRRHAASMALDQQKHADTLQLQREQMALDAVSRAADHDNRQREMDMNAQQADKAHTFNERKFAFDTASAGMREQDDGGFQSGEEADDQAELALKAEMTDAVKRQADAADQLVALVQKVGAALSAPKRVVRDQRGNAVAIEPVAVN